MSNPRKTSESAHADETAAEVSGAEDTTPGQLRLIPPHRPSIPEWEIDEFTRRIGREGVAAARAALRRIRPDFDAVNGRRAG